MLTLGKRNNYPLRRRPGFYGRRRRQLRPAHPAPRDLYRETGDRIFSGMPRPKKFPWEGYHGAEMMG